MYHFNRKGSSELGCQRQGCKLICFSSLFGCRPIFSHDFERQQQQQRCLDRRHRQRRTGVFNKTQKKTSCEICNCNHSFNYCFQEVERKRIQGFKAHFQTRVAIVMRLSEKMKLFFFVVDGGLTLTIPLFEEQLKLISCVNVGFKLSSFFCFFFIVLSLHSSNSRPLVVCHTQGCQRIERGKSRTGDVFVVPTRPWPW